ncbi:MAG: serine hydrolase domain-containing protein, partial [Desulfobulbaceae bacterium]|nr:serine hydrolase domain-containing protein [Desulfobulbaceae bacterium]
DLGFMLLGMIVEKKSHISLANYVRKKVFFPLKIDDDLIFNEKIDLSKKRYYAPTEKCSWRGKVLHGEVHDDNAWAMGGAAGHAGLFGTVKGVAKLVGFILDCIQGRAQHPSITNQDLQQAIHKLSDKGTWGLGFDTRSDQGSSSGHYLSSTSFGHLGYTGTSFWIDPERDMAIILLTNRVYPTRNNQQIKEFRPVFHDRIMELLFFSGNYTG